MTYVLFIHKVENYAKLKQVYASRVDIRKSKGSKGSSAFRDAVDPNQTVVITTFENIGKAKKFGEAEELRTAWQKAGVIDQPAIYYLEEIERNPH